jgi:hypothetical protein
MPILNFGHLGPSLMPRPVQLEIIRHSYWTLAKLRKETASKRLGADIGRERASYSNARQGPHNACARADEVPIAKGAGYEALHLLSISNVLLSRPESAVSNPALRPHTVKAGVEELSLGRGAFKSVPCTVPYPLSATGIPGPKLASRLVQIPMACCR